MDHVTSDSLGQVANSQVVSVLLTSRKSEARKQKKKIKVNHTSVLEPKAVGPVTWLLVFFLPIIPILGVHGNSLFCSG